MNSPMLSSQRSRSQIGCHRRSTTNHLHSDCPPEPEDLQETGLGQRSISLTTLQAPSIVQPRMAQLETLEAKMASIEVSLSSTPRRKKNSLGASIRSIPKELAVKELETLRNALKDKENTIQSLKGQLTIPTLRLSTIRLQNNNNNNNNNHDLTENEKKQAEERLGRLKIEVENKRLTIKNLKMALERLDITDNIDVRIQQAELEYQLGREELNLLTLLEETRALQLCLEDAKRQSVDSHTLYSCCKGNGRVVLLGVEVRCDLKSPKFGASQMDNSTLGLWIDWALEDTGLVKGDRLVEVNGKIVLTKTREDLARLLAVAPDPAQIVILRKVPPDSPLQPVDMKPTPKEVSSLRSELETVKERAEEAQKTKDGLISDKIRLTHRISYLEEQVSELLCRNSKTESEIRLLAKHPIISTVKSNQNVTNIAIRSPTAAPPDLQLYQKGPQLAALVPAADRPARPRSGLSNVSSTHIPAPSADKHRHRHRPAGEKPHRKHHHHHREKDHLMDESYKKATRIVQDLTGGAFEPNTYERHKEQCLSATEQYNTDLLKHYNARKSTSVLDFRSEIHIGPKYPPERALNGKKVDGRSVKSLDFDSDCNSVRAKSIDYQSEPLDGARKISYYSACDRPRPLPPKKPIRLSLHKTTSLQSMDKGDSRKRNYKGETGIIKGDEYLKWAQFNNTHRESIESGSWC